MNLQHAECGGLVKDARPSGGVELAGTLIEVEWVGAIRAAKRATMGELREQTQRLVSVPMLSDFHTHCDANKLLHARLRPER